MENPKKVTGAFALDFDKKEFSTVDAADGWRSYFMQDVSVAAYRAFRTEGLSARQRMARFTERLADCEIESAGHLSARQISFAEEISEIDGRLNFYMETNFDVDAVFGTTPTTTWRRGRCAMSWRWTCTGPMAGRNLFLTPSTPLRKRSCCGRWRRTAWSRPA